MYATCFEFHCAEKSNFPELIRALEIELEPAAEESNASGQGQQLMSEECTVLTIVSVCLVEYVGRRGIDECAKSEDF